MISMKNNFRAWLEGRHYIVAIVAILLSVVLPSLMLVIFRSFVTQLPVYVGYICLPDSANVHNAVGGITFQCQSGSSVVNFVVPLYEVIVVVFIAAAFVCLAPIMVSWERFVMKRLRIYALSAALLCLFVSFGASVLIVRIVDLQLFSTLQMILGNAWIDIVLIMIGLACFGRFYGLAFGVFLVVMNIATQGLQSKIGLILRWYPSGTLPVIPGQSILLYVIVVLTVIAVCLWSGTCGRGLLYFERA